MKFMCKTHEKHEWITWNSRYMFIKKHIIQIYKIHTKYKNKQFGISQKTPKMTLPAKTPKRRKKRFPKKAPRDSGREFSVFAISWVSSGELKKGHFWRFFHVFYEFYEIHRTLKTDVYTNSVHTCTCDVAHYSYTL